jgi:uncharacterized protein
VLIPDANVLLHAVNTRSRAHEQAERWLLRSLRGQEVVAFAWIALIAFLRVSTSRTVFSPPLSAERATRQVENWLVAPAATIAEPTRRHFALLAGLLTTLGTAGNLVNDAHLAALALEHDATIVSFDRDFQRFEGVRSRVPA